MWCLDDIDPMSEAYRRKSRWLSTEPGETLHKTGVDGDVFGGMVEQSADLQQKRYFRWSTVRSEANADHVGLLKRSRDPKNRWHESMHFFTRYLSFFMFVLEIPCIVASSQFNLFCDVQELICRSCGMLCCTSVRPFISRNISTTSILQNIEICFNLNMIN